MECWCNVRLFIRGGTHWLKGETNVFQEGKGLVAYNG